MSIPLPYPNINDTDTNDVQTWSSSKILDYLSPALETEVTRTAEDTGAEVTFDDIDSDTCVITKAEIEILPSQQGSGDPSPDNPRTINTFNTVHITQHNATESATYDISLGTTVSDISGDAVTGEFESVYMVKTFTGDDGESWTAYSARNGFNISLSDMKASTADMTGLATWLKTSATWTDNFAIRFGQANTYIYCIGITNNILDITDVASWKQYLSEHPLTIVYPLANPTSITADPITSDLYEGTNVLGVAPSGTVDIEITCTDTIGNILKKEGIL